MPTININTNNKWEIQKIEVIKCRDCKYYFGLCNGHGDCLRLVDYNTGDLLVVKEDDFCSFGEIKDDNN